MKKPLKGNYPRIMTDLSSTDTDNLVEVSVYQLSRDLFEVRVVDLLEQKFKRLGSHSDFQVIENLYHETMQSLSGAYTWKE
jgi:hypothetical protein